jgi:hypothetical protein
MTQISKGQTFADGQQVTGTRLNQLVDASTLLVGAITAQPAIATNGVASADEMLISDAGILKKTTVSSLLNSNINVTSSTVTTSTVIAPTGGGLTLTTASGQIISTNRPLSVGSSFAVSGTVDIGGLLTCSQGGTMGGTFNFNNAVNFTSTSTVNFSGGTLQIGGSVAYGFKELFESTISRWNVPTANTESTFFQTTVGDSVSFKGGGAGLNEIWVVEADLCFWSATAANMMVRLTGDSTQANTYRAFFINVVAGGVVNTTIRAVIPAGSGTLGNTFQLRLKSNQANAVVTPSSTDLGTGYPDNTLYPTSSRFRVYKYVTA